MDHCTCYERRQACQLHIDSNSTHNSWMILSKFTTANRREEMAAAEMRASATIRSKEEVFATVAGEISVGNEYAFVAIATSYRYVRESADNVNE